MNSLLFRFVFIISILLISVSSRAGGNGVGNGGDLISLKFLNMARALVLADKMAPLNTVEKNFYDEIQNKFSRLIIETQEQVFLGQREVDFANYPERLTILINRSRWNFFLNETMIYQKQIILHELLGVMGYDDSDYQISYELVQKVNLDRWPTSIFNLSELTPTIDILWVNSNEIVFGLVDILKSHVIAECAREKSEFVVCEKPFVTWSKVSSRSEVIFFRYRSTISNEVSKVGSYYWL